MTQLQNMFTHVLRSYIDSATVWDNRCGTPMPGLWPAHLLHISTAAGIDTRQCYSKKGNNKLNLAANHGALCVPYVLCVLCVAQ